MPSSLSLLTVLVRARKNPNPIRLCEPLQEARQSMSRGHKDVYPKLRMGCFALLADSKGDIDIIKTMCINYKYYMRMFFNIMNKKAIYIIGSGKNGTIYTGATSDLVKRIYEHKHKLVPGFTKKYNCNMLFYYEIHETIESAFEREKQVKAGSRKKKIQLIQKMNPLWIDLFDQII